MVIREIFRPGVKHLQRLWLNHEYRNWTRLVGRFGKTPRFTERTIAAGGMLWRVPDVASFLSTWKEMMVDGIYRFTASRPDPVILDIGANIGLSVIFFKKLYPRARVIAYEADPAIYRVLCDNLASAGLDDIEAVNRAVWNAPGMLRFRGDSADGGHLVSGDGDGALEVEAEDIRSILEKHPRIDFLKMDIEGAERAVIPAAGSLLRRAEHIFVEYHSETGNPQEFDRVAETLAEAGFRLFIQSINTPEAPLVADFCGDRFDLQLNIFGKQEKRDV